MARPARASAGRDPWRGRRERRDRWELQVATGARRRGDARIGATTRAPVRGRWELQGVATGAPGRRRQSPHPPFSYEEMTEPAPAATTEEKKVVADTAAAVVAKGKEKAEAAPTLAAGARGRFVAYTARVAEHADVVADAACFRAALGGLHAHMSTRLNAVESKWQKDIGATEPVVEGRAIHYHIADDLGNVDDGAVWHSFTFNGNNLKELAHKLQEETSLEDIIICTCSPINGKLTPLRLQLPPNNAVMHSVLVQESSKGREKNIKFIVQVSRSTVLICGILSGGDDHRRYQILHSLKGAPSAL